jgi:O-antigen/teichoic acid export membrane protein
MAAPTSSVVEVPKEQRLAGAPTDAAATGSEIDQAWDEAGGGILRNSTFALLTQLATAFFAAVLTLYLVRALGPKGYGVFALAVSIGGIVLLPSDFGISTSAGRFIAEHRSDRNAVAGVVSDALKLKLVVSTTVCSALFVLAGVIAHAYGVAGLTWPLRGIAIAIFGQSLLLLLGGTFVALGRTSVYLLLVFSESAIEAGASIALVLLGGGAGGAAFGRATGYVLGSTFALVVVGRRIGRRALDLRWSRRTRTRQIAGYASALLLIDTSFTVFNEIDVLLIGALLSAPLVGFFSAPMRLVTFLYYPSYALAIGVAPRVAASGERRLSNETYLTVLRAGMIIQAGITAVIVVWAAPIVHLLLGPKFAPSSQVLQLLAPLVFLTGIGALTSMSVNYLGEARRRVPIAIVTALVNFVVDLVLLPRIGVIGAAIGTDVAYTLYVIGHLWICTTMLKLDLSALGLTFARTMLAGVAMSAVLAWFGTESLSALQVVGGAVAGSLAYAAMLIITRELTGRDVSAVRAMLSGWRPSGVGRSPGPS